MAVLFLGFALAMAIGTFIESSYSTDTARIFIYNSWWFEAIMAFFVINFLGNIYRYNLFKWNKWPVFILHLSWILIILGAFVTRYIGYEGVMPIREGETENIFYSDKTYITALVDGEINGQRLRKTDEKAILVTPEGMKGSLPDGNFNEIPYQLSFVDFIKGAHKTIVADTKGEEYLKIVASSGGQRREHFIKNGQVASIQNILFALNAPTDGAINFKIDTTGYFLKSPFRGSAMRMADQQQFEIKNDSLQSIHLRSLYDFGGFQFVIPDSLIRGNYKVIPLPETEITDASSDALVVKIKSQNLEKEVALIGGKGPSEFSDKITLGSLDFTLRFGSKVYELPFGIKLNDFIAERYPGTESAYSSFMSRITVNDQQVYDYDIYMNHVLDHKGYRFFQASFDPDEKGTVLSVNHDWWGTWITYTGYFMLYLGLLGIMFFGNTRFKQLAKILEKVQKQKEALTLLFLLFFTFGWAQNNGNQNFNNLTQQKLDSLLAQTLVSKEHAAEFGKLVIQDEGGRMKPINTFSSEVLRKLSGKSTFNGMNSDQVLLSMMINPQLWLEVPFIKLAKSGNDSIRQIVGVPSDQKLVKALDFFDATGMYRLKPFLEEATATNNPNQFQKDFIKAHERFSLLDIALSGSILKIYPLLNDDNNKWISPLDFRGGQYVVGDSLYANFINNSLPYYKGILQQAIATKDYTQANNFLAALKQNQFNHGAEVLPSQNRIEVEIFYNKIDIFNRLYILYALSGLLLFTVLIFQIFKDKKMWRAAIYGFKGLIIILFVWHTIGLALRSYISGHAPWSDAYESILYVAWATVAIGFGLGRKSNLTIAATAFVASMLLAIAHQSWVDPAIANLQPVLDSYWLMIHVAVIVGSYGPLTVGMIIGTTVLLLVLFTNKQNLKRIQLNIKELTVINELALTIGLIMLTIGNFLGGQWANESWGRYWGWDPKETWALISIMIYAFVLHLRLIPGLKGWWTFNFLSIAAYASIMMTYFGVNFYLVGLHSYAQSGSAAITPDYVKYIVGGLLLFGALSFWKYKIAFKDVSIRI